MREKKLDVSGRPLALAFEGAVLPGPLAVTVDGEEHTAEVESVSEGEVLLRYAGKRRRIVLAASAEGTWVAAGGRARLVSEQRARKGAAHGEAEPGAVTPLFPATVAKVLVAVGDSVDKGQGLVVVTAMKTEMTLSAPHAGTVTTVSCAEGDSVSPGEILVEVEDAEEGSDE